jgi:hypothetical protein
LFRSKKVEINCKTVKSWFKRFSSIEEVILGESVTSIGESAFFGCSALKSVIIPNSVTSIGNSAFYGYTGLTSVTIPNSVTSIGRAAFTDCTGLTSVTIPENVKFVGVLAFGDCTNLVNVTLCDGVQEIGEEAFRGCSSLETLYLGSTINSIGNYAFSECAKILEIHNATKAAISAEENIFNEETYINALLVVPTGRSFAYQRISPWSKFYIVEMDFTGIDEVLDEVKSEDGMVKGVYYDLNGRVVENPTNGIYILNGQKVFIK